jgi:hypothetical protein
VSGIQQTVTVTPRGLLSGPSAPDQGERSRPRLHGMQGGRSDRSERECGCCQEDIALRTLTMDYSSPLASKPLGHCVWITDS